MRCTKCPKTATVKVTETPISGPPKTYKTCAEHEPRDRPAGVLAIEAEDINT